MPQQHYPQYVYQQPQAQVRYQPQVQYIHQPVQYLQYQQPVQVQYQRPVQQYQGQYLQKPVYPQQIIQYRPVQNMKYVDEKTIQQIIGRKKSWGRRGGIFGFDGKGNFLASAGSYYKEPLNAIEQKILENYLQRKDKEEKEQARRDYNEIIGKLPLSESFKLDEYGNEYKPSIVQQQPNVANCCTKIPNKIYNVPVQKYVNYNGMYYYK